MNQFFKIIVTINIVVFNIEMYAKMGILLVSLKIYDFAIKHSIGTVVWKISAVRQDQSGNIRVGVRTFVAVILNEHNCSFFNSSEGCQSIGIAEVGGPYTGYRSPDYIMIEEVNVNPGPTADVIPHPQETIFNTQSFFSDMVTLEMGEAFM